MEHGVLIAFLALLGVDLIVVVVVLVGVLARRRWVSRRAGVFAGAIRLASGEHHGLGSKWRRGYGRWVRDVLVWTKKPFLFRNELVPIDRLRDVRPAGGGEVKRLGHEPVVIELAADHAVIQVAANGDHRGLVLGPFRHRAAETTESDRPSMPTANETPLAPDRRADPGLDRHEDRS